jgi:hypothetical protein
VDRAQHVIIARDGVDARGVDVAVACESLAVAESEPALTNKDYFFDWED